MDGPGLSLAEWLRSLDDAELIELLGRRPDVVAARSFDELSDRLSTPWSVRLALESADAAMLQLVDALLVLDADRHGVEPERVERFLGRSPGAVLDRLAGLALAWTDDGHVRIARPLRDLTESPLNLGTPAAGLLPVLNVDQLRTIAAGYGDGSYRRKAELVELLADVLADGDRVRDRLDALPPAVAELATKLAWQGPFLHGSFAHVPPGDDEHPGALVRLGWVLPVGWDAAEMPLEVALAIRGPGYHPPLDDAPPRLPTTTVHSGHLTAGSRMAALATIDGARRLVEHLGRSPIVTVRTGGVGVRELGRVAKAIGAAEPDTRLWLEALVSAGVVAMHRNHVMPTHAADDWLAAEPADALVPLLEGWLDLERLPLHHRDEAGKVQPALVHVVPAAEPLRADVLHTLAQLDPDTAFTDLDALTHRVAWRRPVLYGEHSGPLVAAILAEAELLGLVAERALTPLGRALLAGGLDLEAADLLPPPATTATFLPDLTALVTGTPAAGLAKLLDTTADPETRDAASTWRFSPASIRRAFDAGHTADELVAALAVAADRPLPQPLEYLVHDVARRHGRVQVTAVGSVVVTDGPALATELAAHRSLGLLSLRPVAPTVLVSPMPAGAVLAELRDAGYAPVHHDSTGATVVERTGPARAPATPRRSSVSHPLALAVARLREAPPPTRATESPTLTDIATHAGQLTPPEQRLLADAIDQGHPVTIQYVSAGGTPSTRTIDPEHLAVPLLVAWCHLRQDERHFLLPSITAVTPAEHW